MRRIFPCSDAFANQRNGASLLKRLRPQCRRRLEMKFNSSSAHFAKTFRFLAATTCGALVLAVVLRSNAMRVPAPRRSQDQTAAAKIPPEQLDSLVAPLALYP